MSTNYTTVDEASVDEQTDECQTTVDEWASEVEVGWAAEETPELRASVEQDIQGKVDYALWSVKEASDDVESSSDVRRVWIPDVIRMPPIQERN